MSDHLVVIVGAGASFDCVPERDGRRFRSPHAAFRPPLTSQLFEPRETFASILDRYPGARAAAADINVRIAAERNEPEPAFSLEKYLREELKGSQSLDARYRFRQIPLYLQELLYEVSRGYTPTPDNYTRLVNACLGSLERVVFLTLNYDTFLDRELFFRVNVISGEPHEIDDYVAASRTWILVKLHGSVNWGRRVLSGIPHGATDPRFVAWYEALTPEGGELALEPRIVLRHGENISEMRRAENDLYYPALSVPIGPDAELVNCPPLHVRELQARLTEMGPELDVLVIGYSGLDDEVMDCLERNGRNLRSLHIVDASHDACIRVRDRFADRLSIKPGGLSFDAEGFSSWAQSLRLDEYFGSLRDN